MRCPVLKTPDQLDVRLMPANANHAPSEIAKQLAKMYGLQKQRHNTMDGSSPSNFDHRAIAELAQTPHIALSIIPSQNNDMRGEDLTMEQLNLQLDLIEKAGDMVDQMEATIAEVVNNIDNYTKEHIEQILSVVENTHTLDMVNDGRIALPTAEIERLATETMEAMEQLFKDDVLPPTLKEISLIVIEKTAEIFQIPSLDTRIQEFKQNTSEVSKLTKTIEALKVSLAELLLQDDLPEELREEIEDKLEKLDALEEGEPIPRELMKELSALSESIIAADINIPTELKTGIKAQIEAVKEQNILARAEIHNMSPTQIRAIDSYMDKLEALQENIPNNNDTITLKDMIAEALISLDKNPSSIEAMTAVENVTAHISDPKLTQHIIDSSPEPNQIQKLLPILQTQSKFVESIQNAISPLKQIGKVAIALSSPVAKVFQTFMPDKGTVANKPDLTIVDNTGAKTPSQPESPSSKTHDITNGNKPSNPTPAEPEAKVEPTEPETKVEPAEPEAKIEPAEPETKAEPAEPETKAEPHQHGPGCGCRDPFENAAGDPNAPPPTPEQIVTYKAEKAAEFQGHLDDFAKYQQNTGTVHDFSELEAFMPKDENGKTIEGCPITCGGDLGCCPSPADDFDNVTNGDKDKNTPKIKTAESPPPPPSNIKKGLSLI